MNETNQSQVDELVGLVLTELRKAISESDYAAIDRLTATLDCLSRFCQQQLR